MKRQRYLMGLDVGTTSLKGILVRIDGKSVCEAAKEYTLDYPAAELCELDPEVYWRATRSIIRSLMNRAQIGPEELLGISFSSQGETPSLPNLKVHPHMLRHGCAMALLQAGTLLGRTIADTPLSIIPSKFLSRVNRRLPRHWLV